MTTHISAWPAVGAYDIDPAGSSVSFTGRHMFGTGKVHGRFTIKHGSVAVAEPIEASTVAVEIDATSFHTGLHSRDATVRSGAYLDAERFPVMTFVSDRVVRAEGSLALEGVFTVRDVSRPVRLEITEHSVATGEFTAETNIRIDRREFGITAGRGLTGRFLDVTARIRCVRR